MKKVGIITWHNYPNFGSALQAYALQYFINNHILIEDNGKCELINYVPGKEPAFKRFRLLLSRFDRVISHCISRYIHYRFIAFEDKYMTETGKVRTETDLKSLNNRYDVFVCGSDQIWAPNVFNKVYMLSFVADEKTKISYAASIGLPKIPDSLKSEYKNLLGRFNAISIREEQGRKLLADLGIESTVVLDPSLLVKSEEWRRIAKYNRPPSSYILCYFLGQNEKHRVLVKQIADELGLSIICLSRFAMDKRPSFITDVDAGPQEFIGYINNASMVITDSFHGVCFSINLNKNFYVVPRFEEDDSINQNSRIYNILDLLGLRERLITESPHAISHIDWKRVNGDLNTLRNKSRDFLVKALDV